MSVDVTDLRAFYGGPLGAVAQRHVGRAVHRFLGSVAGLRVLGLGYAVPYLGPVRHAAERTLAFMPATQGVVNWPTTGRTASALVDPTMMPLPEAAVDRVIVIHAIEAVESPAELLQEVWRVLTPGGRLVLVVPNRRGLWARRDATPFGHGQPYSRSQLSRLMRETLFSAEGWAETLYMPPVEGWVTLRTASAWERVGTGLSLPFAGLHVVDAIKQLHRPVAVFARRAARLRAPVLVPAPAPAPVPGGV
ncbi:Methyltransferase type 11 [Methylobacterium sp. 4-46]|uniref:class I SAM-dependent methyltransferase n=1 Tax=unclassified Methylobacterium TaxID=2615210 RepID=UPI000152D82A|nr:MULTISPECIES: class I SAM-dependent methyltransferase [Methylobacterium]ACA16527.1 Methyltransferase type 11 [Methylobacterium sp. 4-46]WFT82236.1 class I SAM-dependent methyltransferase [Methylobacterium nodulans]